jgi:zinc transporter ZupT
MLTTETFFRIGIIPLTCLIFSLTGCFLTDDKLFKTGLKYCRVFSSGVFFSILFFDLIPDLMDDLNYKNAIINHTYLLMPFLTIICSYVVMMIIGKTIEARGGCAHHHNEEEKNRASLSEKTNNEEPESHLEKSNKEDLEQTLTVEKEKKEIIEEKHHKKNKTLKVFYTFLIHDFFTGIFIAISLNSKSFESTLAALILHKLIEGLSLGMKFGSEKIDKKFSVLKLTILSSMILIGTLVGMVFTDLFKQLTVFSESLILGSFIYVAVEENSVKNFTKYNSLQIKFFLLCSYLFGILFIWNCFCFFDI